MDSHTIITKLTQAQTLLNEVVNSMQSTPTAPSPLTDKKATPENPTAATSTPAPSKIDDKSADKEKKEKADRPLPTKEHEQSQDDSPESSIGQTGAFDGEFVVMENGKKFQVPPNYVSKSALVEGDQLKLTKEGERNEFRLVSQVERVEMEAILTKKDNLWVALVQLPDGIAHEFRLVSAAIRYFNGEFGDKLVVLLPKSYEQKLPEWVAVKELIKSDANAARDKLEAVRAGEEQSGDGERSSEQVSLHKQTDSVPSAQPVSTEAAILPADAYKARPMAVDVQTGDQQPPARPPVAMDDTSGGRLKAETNDDGGWQKSPMAEAFHQHLTTASDGALPETAGTDEPDQLIPDKVEDLR